MKHSALLGLLTSFIVSACGATTRAPESATNEIAGRCSGPVTVRTQSDVRSIGTMCRSIDGDLRVLGANVTNLDGLEGLRSVSYVVIAENPHLQNVRGLRGLISARGITVMDNPELQSLEGLEHVAPREGVVIANTAIGSVRGLGDLRQTREVVIAGNARLDSLAGLPALGDSTVLDVENNGAGAASLVTRPEPNVAMVSSTVDAHDSRH